MFINQLRLGSVFRIPYIPNKLWILRGFDLPYHFYFDSYDDEFISASSGMFLEVELIRDNIAAPFFDDSIFVEQSLF